MKRERGVLRTQALEAKKRLGGGFYTGAHQTLESGIKQVIQTQNHAPVDELYAHVARLLEAGASNPLAQLLDHEYMAVLDLRDRERYVFEMS